MLLSVYGFFKKRGWNKSQVESTIYNVSQQSSQKMQNIGNANSNLDTYVAQCMKQQKADNSSGKETEKCNRDLEIDLKFQYIIMKIEELSKQQ